MRRFTSARMRGCSWVLERSDDRRVPWRRGLRWSSRPVLIAVTVDGASAASRASFCSGRPGMEQPYGRPAWKRCGPGRRGVVITVLNLPLRFVEVPAGWSLEVAIGSQDSSSATGLSIRSSRVEPAPVRAAMVKRAQLDRIGKMFGIRTDRKLYGRTAGPQSGLKCLRKHLQ